MKRQPNPRIARWLAGAGLLFSGMIIGSALYMSMHQANFSQLVKRNTELFDENENLKKEIQNLNKFKHSQSVVKKITVRLEKSTLDPLVEQELRQQVQKKLEPFYEGHSLSIFTAGKESERLAEIRKLQEIVTNQYSVNDQSYKLEATGIAIVQTELIVFVKTSAALGSIGSFHFR
ncbi:hypothetical protein PV433_01590 [Paenibacillus sp. GYB004]|uniref:hypothetical protein n=1 Tax=Paenibacillus sp. GYB004 TaxID=2994393 RepID=UPI002F969774